jgi:hypothetical protein
VWSHGRRSRLWQRSVLLQERLLRQRDTVLRHRMPVRVRCVRVSQPHSDADKVSGLICVAVAVERRARVRSDGRGQELRRGSVLLEERVLRHKHAVLWHRLSEQLRQVLHGLRSDRRVPSLCVRGVLLRVRLVRIIVRVLHRRLSASVRRLCEQECDAVTVSDAVSERNRRVDRLWRAGR